MNQTFWVSSTEAFTHVQLTRGTQGSVWMFLLLPLLAVLSCTARITIILWHIFMGYFLQVLYQDLRVSGTRRFHRWLYEGTHWTSLPASPASWTAAGLAGNPAARCVCHQSLPWQLLGSAVSAKQIRWWNRDHREPCSVTADNEQRRMTLHKKKDSTPVPCA